MHTNLFLNTISVCLIFCVLLSPVCQSKCPALIPHSIHTTESEQWNNENNQNTCLYRNDFWGTWRRLSFSMAFVVLHNATPTFDIIDINIMKSWHKIHSKQTWSTCCICTIFETYCSFSWQNRHLPVRVHSLFKLLWNFRNNGMWKYFSKNCVCLQRCIFLTNCINFATRLDCRVFYKIWGNDQLKFVYIL